MKLPNYRQSLRHLRRSIIIGNMLTPIDLNLIGEKERLEKILEEYQKCKSNDIKDLIRFEKILKNSFVAMTEGQKYAQKQHKNAFFLSIFTHISTF